MTESAGMTLIETQVKAVTGFNSDNVSIAKWGMLNKGKSNHYAIIRPGPAERTRSAFGVLDINYRTVVEVWQRLKDEGSSLTNLTGHVDAIAARLDKYRKLADDTNTIRDAEPSGLGEVTEEWRREGGPAWLKREIFVDWTEESEVSYAE